MSGPRDLDRLARLARGLRDDRLARLAAAEATCARTRAQIAALTGPDSAGDDPAGWRNAMAYQMWAEARRTELGRQLQDQTAARAALLPEAQRAFGRAEVLARLAQAARTGR
jgi:hypothetical protein